MQQLRCLVAVLPLVAGQITSCPAGLTTTTSGCSDTTKANYNDCNKADSAQCYDDITIYCPDSNADNYNQATGEPRPALPADRLPLSPPPRRAHCAATHVCALHRVVLLVARVSRHLSVSPQALAARSRRS